MKIFENRNMVKRPSRTTRPWSWYLSRTT